MTDDGDDGERSRSVSRAPKPQWWQHARVPLALLGLILLIAGALRFHRLTEDSFWLDELYSLASSTGRYPDMSPLQVGQITTPWPNFTSLEEARPWWYVWVSHRDGTHPPLYLIILRGWREAFGEGDFAARSLSVVAGVIGIALIYDVGRLLYNPWAGLFAAVLMTIAYPQVYFSQEARPYAVLIAFGLGTMDALARIERGGANWRRLVALGACSLAMALTHYLCVGALAATGIYVLIRFGGTDRKRAVVALVTAAVLFLILWGPSLWWQRREAYTREFVREPNALTVFNRLDWVPQKFLVDPSSGWGLVRGAGYVLLLAPLVALRWRRDLLLPYLWLVMTVGAVAALDVTRGLKLLDWTRYSLLASVGLYLVLAGFFARLPALAAAVALVVLTIHCALVLPDAYDDRRLNADWRALALDIAARSEGPELVVFGERKEWEGWLAGALAMGVSHYMPDLNRPVLVLNEPPTTEVTGRLRSAGVFWYVSLYAPPQQLLGPVEVLYQQRVPRAPATANRIRLAPAK
jgi:hypothetical protein